ncbi:Transmembrane secretion effector [Austwickia chelonae]|uniref:Putative major facilitator superfamily transporter n=1 Tax=Austwickia chelonae NBRC 105200 TaxID=1184607 RepID=K6VV77_9MICO|nr:MFS transporter [Austwickia chelonae]GAB79245.1 putative major facilitator superfamily transporter [Austwickia chelonae NBRC 105200]SEW37560.1 Transmembrane secretion effector [Austwickia chelonae]
MTPPLQHNQRYRIFWAGGVLSSLGTSLTAFLLNLIAVLPLQASPVWIGLLNAAVWLPWLLLGLPLDVAVNRGNSRRTMAMGQLAAAFVLATIPIAWAVHRLYIAHLVVAAVTVALATVLFRAGYPRLVIGLVRRRELGMANNDLTRAESTTQIVGPALGGLTAAVLAPAFVVAINICSHLGSAVALLRLPAPRNPPMPGTACAEAMRQVRAGWRVTFHDPYLRFFSVQGAVSNAGLTGLQTLMVLVLVRDLGLDPAQAGLAVATQALGSLSGVALAPRICRALGDIESIMLLYPLVGIGGLLLPRWTPGDPHLPHLLAGTFLIGCGVVCGNMIRAGWRQNYVPAVLLARQVTASQSVNIALMTLAAVGIGWLAASAGSSVALSVVGSVVAVSSFGALVGTPCRRRTLPDRPSPALLQAAQLPPPGWVDVR